MPLDVQRLRDSDLAALESPEACWAAVILWCVSWHQVPAASLPDDDRILAKFTGYQRAPKDWQKIKKAAMRGWVLCSDGRFYHPVVAEKARESFAGKLKQRWATECARIKKSNQRHETKNPEPSFEYWMSQRTAVNVPRDSPKLSPKTIDDRPQDVPRETASKGQGEGKGKGKGQGKEVSKPRDVFFGLDHVKPCEETGRSLVNGWYLDRTQERVFEAAKIDNARWMGNIKPLISWLADGIEPDTIVAAIARRAEQANYAVPHSLNYFDIPVRAAAGRTAA